MRSILPRVNNTLEPPSPELHENSLESGASPPGSSPTNPHSSPLVRPPAIPPVGMPDPEPTSVNPASCEGNRRTIGEWFRKEMTKNRTPRQMPSEAPPQSGIPEATPPNKKFPTMSLGQWIRVSVSFSVDTRHGYLTTRLSGRLEGPQLDHRLVHDASYAFMDIIVAYRASSTPKPAVSSQPPKTTPCSEAGPANVPNEMKADPAGVQNNEEVRIHFVRLAAGAHNNSCSKELGDYRRTSLMFHFPSNFPCRYPHGFVAAVRAVVERIRGAASICGRRRRYPVFIYLLSFLVARFSSFGGQRN